MRGRILLLVIVAALSATAAALAAQGEAPHTTGRAAGMPLRDGALAPGMLTVRVVRGGFSANLTGQDVQLEVSGEGARRAPTGSDGRAEFAHVTVGSRVRAWTVVGGERLESEPFEVPAEAGVRLLLVAEDDAVAARSDAARPILTAEPRPAAVPAGMPASRSVAVIRMTLVALTAAALGVVVWRLGRTG